MKYYSHSKLDEKGIRFGSKELTAHNQGIKNRIQLLIHENLGFTKASNEIIELLFHIVDFHDFGKHTVFFQNYLLNQDPIDLRLKRHAQIGGILSYNQLKTENIKDALISLYIIFHHHSNLSDVDQLIGRIDNLETKDILLSQSKSLENKLKEIESINQLKNLEGSWVFGELDDLCLDLEDYLRDDSTIEDYYLINFLFSLLIEGDKMDASDTEVYSLVPINKDSVDNRFGKPDIDKTLDLKNLSNNQLRNFCRNQVVSHIEDENILEQFLFTLTAPTGIGKTMTALDFSLKLKSKIKTETGIEARIIYGLPFINIIEQALSEYKKTLSDEIKILGHYQFADIFGDEREDDETNYNQKLMLLDTWQADIVITSFVQFFETLLGNRNKLLKKFNHYAHAIIILDEVQTLALEKLPLIGSALFYLTKFMKSRVILMTATRPKILELANKHILSYENENAEALELLTDFEEVFAVFNRTKIVPLLEILNNENKTEQFVQEVFAEKWSNQKSCLIVCNNIQRSIEVYNAIDSFLKENDFKNPLFYLSTNIVPANRLGIIDEIKQKMDKSPILIATQVVEAGVDLDFDMGFRDIGPIDSIIQVAGRINRNNNHEKSGAPLYIIDFDRKITSIVYGPIAYTQAKKALSRKSEFSEQEYLELITKYFDDISDREAFDQSKCYFESMKSLRYISAVKNKFPIGDFRIIESSDKYKSVFIELNDEAEMLRQKYAEKIQNIISKEEFDKNYKLRFHQYIISVPKYLCDDLKQINEWDDHILVLPMSEVDYRYNLKTGFIRNYQSENKSFVF
ncbi:MAG: CRISPR-associated helicase Cas3' [Flavobacteriaceae bacterium]|nr:CRISPR-associated helicase Cas3' [Flavobacteriaceae bacterium]